MRALTSIVLFVVALMPASALGHGGGGYRGPPGEVPPDSVEPSDPPPPPDECDPFLDAIRCRHVSDDTARARIAPALRTLLASPDRTKYCDVRAAAAIALARIGGVEIADELMRRLRDGAEHHEVREAAAIGLGVAANDPPATRAVLSRLLRSTASDFMRSSAAVSLGLLGGNADESRDAATALIGIVADAKTDPAVKTASLLALGLLGTDSTVRELATIARTGRATPDGAVELGDTETSYAVTALDMTGGPGDGECALDAIVDTVRGDTSAGLETRGAAVLALGHIAGRCGRAGQRRAADLLRSLAADGGAREHERLVARTALGRLGAATDDRRMRERIAAFLGDELCADGALDPASAALALGVIGRAVCQDSGSASQRDICEPLRAAFRSSRDVTTRGTVAFASGLARDPLAVGAFLNVLGDGHAEPWLQIRCALALAMIGDDRGSGAIQTALRGTIDRGRRVDLAVAAALLGDASAGDVVLEVLRDREADGVQVASAALVLGRIGHDDAVEGLVAIVLDETYPSRTRTLAVTALGQTCGRRDDTKLAYLAADLPWFPSIPAVAALLDLR